MKKYLFILLLSCAFVPFTQAQQVPQGMKYQAVARSLMGEVLANQPVTLKISLNSKLLGSAKVHYSETHTVTTNALGLFDLTIGAGKVGMGTFKNVPWSTEDIWMEIAIQDGGKSGFSTVSSSRLLAVPYAFHAMTANELAGSPKARVAGGPDDGVPSNVWSTFGNTRTNPATDRMGTMDYVDLIFVTNKEERLRITKDGDINIKTNLNVGNDVVIGNDLTVKQDVFLNTTGGATINNGPLTVANGKPTVLTGTLNVNGATDLDNTLNVDGVTTISNPTESTGKTNGALVVVGGAGIGKNINVGGNGDVDGTLNVDGATTLNNTLNVVGNTTINGLTNITNVTQSTLPTTGALIVAGGAGIGKNINVGGNGDVDGTLNVDGITTVSNATESASKTNGALVVVGGAGIGKNINVGGNGDVDGTLNVDGATTLKNILVVDGATTVNNTLNVVGNTTIQGITNIANTAQSTLPTNGAFVVAGGVGVGKNLNVGGNQDVDGTLNSDGATTLKSTLAVDGAADLNSSLNVDGVTTHNAQVTINANLSGNDNSDGAYPLRVKGSNQGIVIEVSGSRANANNFVTFRDNAGIQGRIEGQTYDELTVTDEFIATNALFAGDGATIAAEGIACGFQLDLGEVAVMAAQVIVVAAQAGVYNGIVLNKVGVAFESGSGDYAEWLEKSTLAETFSYGDIVGVRGGKITKNTQTADHFMVISLSPIVLGNMPKQGEEKNYHKVAFMGQVPVKVTGKVAVGDYILPRGDNKGFGIAVNPAKMTLEQYRQIVGVAWTASKANTAFSMINVAVGINSNDLVAKLLKQQAELDEVKVKMNGIVGYLKAKDANFNQELFAVPTSAPVAPTTAVAINPSPVPVSTQGVQSIASLKENFVYSDFNDLFEKNPKLLAESMASAKKTFENQGADLSKSPELNRLLTDKEYLQSTIKRIYGTKK